MRILVISPFAVSKRLNGGSIRIREIARGLARHAERVDLLALINPHHDRPGDTRLAANLRVFEVRGWAYALEALAHLRIVPRGVLFKRFLRHGPLPRLRIDAAYDVIIHEFPWTWGMVPEVRAGLRVFSAHNTEVDWIRSSLPGTLVRNGALRTIARMEKRALHEAGAVVFCAPTDRERMFELYGETSACTLIAHNGFRDEGRVRRRPRERADARTRLGAGPDERIALFVGNPVAPNVEGILALDRALKEHPELTGWRFFVVGSIKKRLPPDLDSRFVLFGYQEDLSDFFQAADVSVNPMLSGSGSNLKFMEALSNRLPVLTTPFGARGFERTFSGVHIAPIERFPEALSREEPFEKPVCEEIAPFSWGEIAGTYFEHLLRWTGAGTDASRH